MSNWEKTTIGNLCDSISDTYKRNDDHVVLINTSDVLEGNVLNHQPVLNQKLKGQFKKTFRINDILYSEIRPANKRFAFIDFKDTSHYIASTKLMVLRPRTDIILPEFLFAILKSKNVVDELQYLAETRSGTFPQITFSSELAPMEVRVPDIPTQKRIVSVLKAIEDKIKINTAINENLEQQAQALYRQMFVNADDNQSATIADISLNVTDGVHNTVKDDPEGNYLLLSCKNIKGGSLSIGSSERHINKETFDKLRKRTQLAKGDILISSVGTIGETLMLNTEPKNYEFQRSVAMIKPDTKIVSSAYVYESLLYKKAELINAAHGAVQQCLFISDICEFPIDIPSKVKLDMFNSAVIPMFDIITAKHEENQRLVALRDTLLPKLMSGELDVSQVQI